DLRSGDYPAEPASGRRQQFRSRNASVSDQNDLGLGWDEVVGGFRRHDDVLFQTDRPDYRFQGKDHARLDRSAGAVTVALVVRAQESSGGVKGAANLVSQSVSESIPSLLNQNASRRVHLHACNSGAKRLVAGGDPVPDRVECTLELAWCRDFSLSAHVPG